MPHHDLLTRLKAHAKHKGLDANLYGERGSELYQEAADEIEHLRGLLSEAIDLIPTGDERGNPYYGELDFIERAKAAIVNEQLTDK